jgi:hypothetical protein
MLDVSHVHADLVRAAGLELGSNEAMAGEPLEDTEAGHGRAALSDHRHASALRRVAPDRGLDPAPGHDLTDHQGTILAMHLSRLELGDKRPVSRQRLGHHQQAGRILIQSMHDSGARHSGKRGGMMQQGILQGAIAVPRRRMHNQSGRFIDHEELVVFEDQVECDGLGEAVSARLNQRIEMNDLAGPDLVAGATGHPVDANLTTVDPMLQTAAREFRHGSRQHLIESASRQMRLHPDLPSDALA